MKSRPKGKEYLARYSIQMSIFVFLKIEISKKNSSYFFFFLITCLKMSQLVLNYASDVSFCDLKNTEKLKQLVSGLQPPMV